MVHLQLDYPNLTRGAELNGAEPLEGRLPAPLLSDVNLLDEAQAGQHVGDVVQTPHLSWRRRDTTFSSVTQTAGVDCPKSTGSLTFVLAVTR